MADTSWTGRYAAKTVTNLDWETSQGYGSFILGIVIQNGIRIRVTWVVKPNGDMSCPNNGDYDVLLLIPFPSIQYPTRDVDSPFIISQTQDATVRYSVILPTKLLALGSDEATVALLADGVEITRVSNIAQITVGLTIGDLRTPKHILSGAIKAGQTVTISTVAASSSAAAPSIFSAQESLL